MTVLQMLNVPMSKNIFNLLNEGTRHMLLKIQRRSSKIHKFMWNKGLLKGMNIN